MFTSGHSQGADFARRVHMSRAATATLYQATFRGGSTMGAESSSKRAICFNGDIELSMEGLPMGVTATA